MAQRSQPISSEHFTRGAREWDATGGLADLVMTHSLSVRCIFELVNAFTRLRLEYHSKSLRLESQMARKQKQFRTKVNTSF